MTMHARETQLLTLLAGQLQFVIPIFQRDYSWMEAECDRLLADVLSVADGPEGAIHFLGSIVWVGSEQSDAVLSQRLVIDGQQRLTTSLLLILALRDHLRASGLSVAPADSPEALQNQYLLNPYVDRSALRSKLQLRRLDNEWLQHLLLEMPAPTNTTSRVPLNLAYMRQRLADLDATRVIKGLRRLMIVSVALTPGQDNPQLIFESLNSTGMKLTQADLVRNYVLMGHAEQLQTDWYQRYWQPLESAFGEHYRAMFDSFLRDFLTLELRPFKPFKLDNVYTEFKRWYPAYLNRAENHAQAIDLLQRMARFGRYYSKFVIGPAETPVVEMRLARLRQLVDVAATAVMVLYERLHHNQTLSQAEFCEAIDILESYVFRRSVVGAETRSGGTVFAALAVKISITSPLSSLKARLALMGRSKEFPGDRDFADALTSNDLYHRRTCFYMLARMTNTDKEKILLDGLTIEHILPQKTDLAAEWQKALGPEWMELRQTWLHRLGNLTLTAFNSEFQAKPFLQKRDRDPGGYANSPVWLNKSLAKLDTWGVKEIEERGQMLANHALSIWQPLLVDETAIQQAELEDAIEASGGKSLKDVMCSENVRQWLLKLSEFTTALGEDVTELPNLRSVVYRMPTWFAELLPRANGIDVRLACEPTQLAGMATGISSCASWAWIANSSIPGTEGAIFLVNTEAKVEVARQLIRRAYEMAQEESI